MNTPNRQAGHRYDALDNHQLAHEARKALPAAERAALHEEMTRRREALLRRPDWHKEMGAHATRRVDGTASEATAWFSPKWVSAPTLAIVWCKWMAGFAAVPALLVFQQRSDLAFTLLLLSALMVVVGLGLKRKIAEAAYGFFMLLALLLLAAWGLSTYEWSHAVGGRAAAGLVKGIAYLAAACAWGAVAALQVALSLRQQGWRPLHPAQDEGPADESSTKVDP